MHESTEPIALTEGVFYILLSLYKPMHGYGMIRNIETLSNQRVTLGAGTLYGAINVLLERRWIRALPGELMARKKEYEITETGKAAVSREIARLEELLAAGKAIHQEGSDEA